MNYNNKISGMKRCLPPVSLPQPPVDIEAALHAVFGAKAAGAILRADQRGGCGPAPVRSALAGVGDLAVLGVRVDASPVAHGAVLTADDEALLDRVATLPDVARDLVVRYAEAGTRPELVEGKPRFLPVTTEAGRPIIVYRDQAKRRGPLWCLVEQDPLPEHRTFCRERWRLWWDALDLLAAECKCLPPACPREPWNEAHKKGG